MQKTPPVDCIGILQRSCALEPVAGGLM